MQNSYSYKTPKGVAGGLLDLSPYSVDSRINGETTPGALKFGMGVVQGATPGTNVKLPTSASTADNESSNTIIGVFCISIRAIAVLCFWPPDSVTPLSPTRVSYPLEKFVIA